MSNQEVRVPGWPQPKGYANGRVASGRSIHVAGQIGWDEHGTMLSGMVAQFAKALDNVITVVRTAGGAPEDIAMMTIFVTDLPAYRSGVREIGAAWRERLGKHFPAITMVEVKALLEPQALVEVQATAYVGGEP